MRFICLCSAVVAFTFVCDEVAAQSVTYVAQERSVFALHRERIDGDRYQDFERISAPGFDDCDAWARALAVPPPPFTGSASVSQRSSLRPDGIIASGSMHGSTGDDGSYEWTTLVAATFDLTGASARYELTYAIDDIGPQPYYRHNDFVLTRISPDASPVFQFAVPHDRDGPVTSGSLWGVLAPGRYEFRYRDENLNDIGLFGDYEWSLRLTPVPEPAGIGTGAAVAAVFILRRRPGR